MGVWPNTIMDLLMKLSELFITGCDSNTSWMLPWFKTNFYKHNPNAQLHVFDFDTEFTENQRWFKKPAAMVAGSKMAQKVCWIDTDIEIKDHIQDIWQYLEPNKLGMVIDQPWTIRRKETWHNSGVVAFDGKPNILDEWAKAIVGVDQSVNPMFGDQDVLHNLVKDGFRRMIHITDLPKMFNTLRIDQLDGTMPKHVKMMHWTGAKGKQHIRSLINE